MCSLEVILANRLVLNLRTHSHSHDLPNPTTKTDMFFRQAYGGSRIDGRFQTAIDSVLGNIGAPLRVGNDPEDGEEYEVQNPMPVEDREHSVEDGVDPLSLEGAQSERVADANVDSIAAHMRTRHADHFQKEAKPPSWGGEVLKRTGSFH